RCVLAVPAWSHRQPFGRPVPAVILAARRGVLDAFFLPPFHAQQPLIAFGFAEGEGRVEGAQSRVAEAFDVERRPAHPSRQKHKQLLARMIQRFGVQRANALGFGYCVHQIVETVHQRAYRRLAADGLIKCLSHLCVCPFLWSNEGGLKTCPALFSRFTRLPSSISSFTSVPSW